MTAAIHPSAVIDPGARIGEGTRIWHFCHVMEDARIGDRCVLGQNVFIGKGVWIGHGVRIQNNVSVYAGVQVEDDVFLGPSCVFTNVINPRATISRKDAFKTTVIGKGATIGANATLICGNNIGKYAFVGAGAVVTRPVRDFELVRGNPARHGGWVSLDGEKLTFDPDGTGTDKLGNVYRLTDGRVEMEGKNNAPV